MAEALQPYGSLRTLAKDVHVIDGEWYGVPFGRRMTVLGLSGGRVLVHNAFRLREEDLAAVTALGRIAYIVVPNRFHNSEPDQMKLRFPEARLLASPEPENRLPAGLQADGVLPADWPAELASEVECFEFLGTRMIREIVLYHRASRTLVITDIAFNMAPAKSGVQRFFFRINRLGGGFAPSRLFEQVFTRDRAAVRASLERILNWDFDRIVLNHGEVVESNGRATFQRGFARFLAG